MLVARELCPCNACDYCSFCPGCSRAARPNPGSQSLLSSITSCTGSLLPFTRICAAPHEVKSISGQLHCRRWMETTWKAWGRTG